MYIRGKWLCSEELLILIFLPLIGIYIICYLGPDLWIIFHRGLLECVAGAPKDRRFSFPSPVALNPLDNSGEAEEALKDGIKLCIWGR